MISFAIPTYKRVNILKTKTLKLLASYKIPSRDIFIFVADKEEERLYRSAVGSGYKIVVGIKGIAQQRNFISKYFKEGSKIVYIDDDIDMINELEGSKQIKLPDLIRFTISAFKECEEHKAYIWGIYPSDNGFFQKRNITYDRRLIIGGMYGIINRHKKELMVSIVKNEKEDYERTLRYYKNDGVVVRYNFISVKTRNYAEGGIKALIDRVGASKLNSERLLKAFPNDVSVVEPTKSNKYWELKILSD